MILMNMRSRFIQFIPLAVVAGAIGTLYVSDWCILVTKTCYGTWISHIAFSFTEPLYFFALYSLPLAIVLIFIRPDVFKGWLKIALWGCPYPPFLSPRGRCGLGALWSSIHSYETMRRVLPHCFSPR
jgi:hypothetical protein